MQLGKVHLAWMGDLLSRGGRVSTFQKTLPHGVLREGLGAALTDQTVHDLVLCIHGAQDPPAGYLTVGGLRPVAAVQTWKGRGTGFNQGGKIWG